MHFGANDELSPEHSAALYVQCVGRDASIAGAY
jgi:hypothetical protein